MLFWLGCNAQCINLQLNPSHVYCSIHNKCVSKINLEGGGYFLLFDPLECDRCRAYLEGGDMSAEPLHTILNWVEEIKSTGVTVSWKEASLQNFMSLNISAHNLDKNSCDSFSGTITKTIRNGVHPSKYSIISSITILSGCCNV